MLASRSVSAPQPRIEEMALLKKKELARKPAVHPMIPKASVVGILLLILVADFLPLSAVLAQSKTAPAKHPEAHWQEAGLPFIQNFDPKEYGASAQNVGMVRDHRGLMYFANISGVLEYDGVSWRLIRLPNSAAVWSVAIDKDGVIYAGGEAELGYLAPDSLGQLGYVSLLDRLPQKYRDSFDILKIIITSQGVYFNSKEFLFLLRNLQAKKDSGTLAADPDDGPRVIWKAKTTFEPALGVRDTVYVPQVNIGLMKLVGDSLRLAPGGQQFKNAGITVLLPLRDPERYVQASHGARQDKYRQRLLVGASTSGLFLYDGVSFKPFKTEADVFLRENQLSRGVNLADGTLALGTQRGGVAIIDQQGRLRQIINKTAGLRHEDVNALYQDPADGALWLALDNGLARVDTPAPLSIYSDKLGINGSVLSVLRHRGRLYAATHQGVYSLSIPSTRNTYPVFQPVSGIRAYSGSLLAIEKTLFAATIYGIYRIDENQAIQVCDLNSILLYQSPSDPKRVYIGGGGLALLQEIDGQWRFTGRVSGTSGHVISIVEDEGGIVWLGNRVAGVLRVKMPASTSHLPTEELTVSIQRYGPAHGLPVGKVYVCSVNGRVLFATQKGLRRFDPMSRSFVPDSTFGLTFADTTRYLHRIVEDAKGRVWIPSGDQNKYETGAAMPRKDGSYMWQSIPSLRLADMSNTWDIFSESNGVVWFGNDDGIVRYDPAAAKDYAVDFPALVRRVVVNGDSAIYGGALLLGSNMEQGPRRASLAYQNNTMRFEYAAPSYAAPTRNRYQVLLEGFDQGWSGWTEETRKDYTNLPGADYRFRVRAKNVYEHLSSEGVYEFIILPPWYRTYWAYAFYAVVVSLLFYGTGRFQAARVQQKHQRRHQRELERVELKKLQELDRLKSDFFANISHEFRTPLTLVLGPLKDALAKSSEHISFGNLKMMRRNADRLLRLINQLLDLSKLQTGKMQLRTRPGDFVPFLKGLTMSFESLAAQKNISLRFQVHPCEDAKPSQDLTEAYFDRDKIEKIFSNLLSNALKFTPDQGCVDVTCTLIAACRHRIADSGTEQKYQLRSPKCEVCANTLNVAEDQNAPVAVNCVEVMVKDTGIGISTDRLPHIFDRFYQVDTSSTRENEGTGIGLALVKDLVELHNGSIEVASEEGHGTTFTVCLPLGRDHLLPEEIVEDASSTDISLHPASKGDLKKRTLEGSTALAAGSSHENQVDAQPYEGLEPSQGFDEDAAIILIVEDNSDVRTYIRGCLEAGYKILEAKDGEEGIEKATETIPDLVISDVMMPKKNGYEVCAALKSDERTSHIPVILLTAKAAAEEKIAGLETGADDYLIKPFDSKELLVRVKNLIALRKKLRQRFSTATTIKPREVSATPMDQVFLQRVIDTIEAQLADEDFNINTLGNSVGMSPSQINRKLNALIDQSGGQLIRSMRLHHAASLLKQKAGNVTEICFKVGFNNLTTFNRSFKKQFGVSPNQYPTAE